MNSGESIEQNDLLVTNLKKKRLDKNQNPVSPPETEVNWDPIKYNQWMLWKHYWLNSAADHDQEDWEQVKNSEAG